MEMRHIWLVLKHTVSITLRQRSFWLFTFLMPLFMIGFNVFYSIQGSGLVASDVEATAEMPESPVIGLVDEGGLIKTMPEGIPLGMFEFYDDAARAAADLEAGTIDQYVIIPADYPTTGQVELFSQEFQMLSSGGQGIAFNETNTWMLTSMLSHNLVGDEVLAKAILNPTIGQGTNMHALNPPSTETVEKRAMAEIVALIIPYIYYFILIVVSGYMLQSVTKEKENRTVEILLLSVPPRDLMVGKIVGLSVVAIVQLAVWLGGGFLLMDRGTQLLNVTAFTFPDGFVVLAIIFLLLGYFLYASIMAAAGAISPSAREAGQVTWLLIIPLLPTLMFNSAFVNDPDGAIALILSLFPLSAPSAMITRLAVAEVPWWQVALSMGGLAVTTYLAVVLAGRFFQPRHLLSDASFNWRRLITGWRQ
jgi:ABC-2 type transport system permease protein